jgi:hypothetical protein
VRKKRSVSKAPRGGTISAAPSSSAPRRMATLSPMQRLAASTHAAAAAPRPGMSGLEEYLFSSPINVRERDGKLASLTRHERFKLGVSGVVHVGAVDPDSIPDFPQLPTKVRKTLWVAKPRAQRSIESMYERDGFERVAAPLEDLFN